MSGEHNFEAFAKAYHNEKLAEVAECHKSTVYAYKKGKPIPSDIVIRIADYYKVSTDRVLGRVLPAEALTKENFPNARPNVAFTVSETQLDHAKENRELKFNLEMRNKRIAELEADLAELKVYKEHYEKLSLRHNEILDELQASKAQPDTTTPVTNALEKSELGRLRAILQSIHFLSEEK